MSETVVVPAEHLLQVLRLVAECVEDLAEDEQATLGELHHLLLTEAPATCQAHRDRNEAIGEFYRVAVEGGLMSFGPEFDAECQEFGCHDDGTAQP